MSDSCKDLIFKLMSPSNIRLGKFGAKEIKIHPYFKGINWKDIRSMKPPFIPKLKDNKDTKYFDKFEEEDPWWVPENDIGKQLNLKKNNYQDYLFLDFTLKKNLE